MTPIPGHVLAAFQLEGPGEPTSPAWDNGLRFGRVVVSPAPAAAVWSAKARELLAGSAEGLRVSKPVRATDGRLVVGGFTANEFVPGTPAARVDEAVSGALLFDAALAPLTPPGTPSPQGPEDPWAEADRRVWAGEDLGGERTTAHLDFLSCCLFDGSLPPTLSAIAPSSDPRPRGYTAALVIVDGLLAGAVDAGVMRRWAHIPRIGELAAKALEFRRLAPGGQESNVRSNFERVARIVSGSRATI